MKGIFVLIFLLQTVIFDTTKYKDCTLLAKSSGYSSSYSDKCGCPFNENFGKLFE